MILHTFQWSEGFYILQQLLMFTAEGITISMDGRGRAIDNIYIERFWRTIKQEYIYIWPAEDGNILVSGIKEYMNYYNNHRTHQSLDRKTPYDWYEFAA